MPSDLQGIRTNAKRDGDDWILNGSKVFITNGINADVVIVVAVTNPEAKSPAHGISLFLVEAGMPGFKKGRLLDKIGLKAQVMKRKLQQYFLALCGLSSINLMLHAKRHLANGIFDICLVLFRFFYRLSRAYMYCFVDEGHG